MAIRFGKLAWKVVRTPVKCIGIALLVLVVVASLPLMLPGLYLEQRRKRRKYRRFLTEHRGRLFLVWQRRRGWNDFVQNNVLPALPPDIEALLDRRGWHGKCGPALGLFHWTRWTSLEKWLSSDMSRPYLALLGRKCIYKCSLNSPLRALKISARRDPAVQAAVQRVVQKELRRVVTRELKLTDADLLPRVTDARAAD